MAIDKQAVLEQLDQDTQRFRGLVNGDENDTVELEQRTEKSVAGQVKERVDEVIVGDYIRVANWEDLSGSFSPPLIVRYNSFYYQLNGSVSEIENETPVNNPNYTRVNSDLKERLRREATLDLDFQRGKYRKDDGELVETTDASELLTIQRATPKWVWGPNGKLREVPPDTVAREWDPETGKPLGVLIEGEATNLQSNSWGWEVEEGESSTFVESVFSTVELFEESPTGKSTVWTEEASETEGPYGYSHTISEADENTPYISRTFIIKDISARYVTVGYRTTGVVADENAIIDLETATVVRDAPSVRGAGVKRCVKLADGSVLIDTVQEDGGGMSSGSRRRTGIGFASPDGTTHSYVSGAGGRQFRLIHVQTELAPHPSSIIPTDGAPVTRAADNLSRELGEEFVPSGFSALVKFGTLSLSVFLSFGGADSQNDVQFVIGPSYNRWRSLYRKNGSGAFSDDGAHGHSGYTDYVVGVVVRPEEGGQRMQIFHKGALVHNTFHSREANFSLTRMRWNRGLFFSRTSPIFRLKGTSYYPRALSEAELIELTTISEEE